MNYRGMQADILELFVEASIPPASCHRRREGRIARLLGLGAWESVRRSYSRWHSRWRVLLTRTARYVATRERWREAGAAELVCDHCGAVNMLNVVGYPLGGWCCPVMRASMRVENDRAADARWLARGSNRARQRSALARRRERWLAFGMCRDCGRRREHLEHTRCDACLDKLRAAGAARRAAS